MLSPCEISLNLSASGEEVPNLSRGDVSINPSGVTSQNLLLAMLAYIFSHASGLMIITCLSCSRQDSEC